MLRPAIVLSMFIGIAIALMVMGDTLSRKIGIAVLFVYTVLAFIFWADVIRSWRTRRRR